MKSNSRRKLKWYLIALFVIGLPLVAIVIIKGKQLFQPEQAFEFPAETITAAPAESMIWEQSVSTVASLRASQGVLISAEVSGIVSKLHFVSGQAVEAGDLLFELDSSVEKAQLEAAQATFNLAKVNLRRADELLESKTISRSEYDAAAAQGAQAKAEVERIKATLEKRRVVSPFAGRLGIRQIDLGEYLNPGAAVVSLQAFDPIYADFSLNQRQLGWAEPGYEVTISIDTFPDTKFTGRLEALEPNLDESSRMVKARALVPNSDGRLKPGMFASIKVVQPNLKELVAVPSTAISYQSYGNTVFVVSDVEGEKIVDQRFVSLGEKKGDYVEVSKGLEVGEVVATSAVFKLSQGRKVTIDNSKAIDFSLTPKPKDS